MNFAFIFGCFIAVFAFDSVVSVQNGSIVDFQVFAFNRS